MDEQEKSDVINVLWGIWATAHRLRNKYPDLFSVSDSERIDKAREVWMKHSPTDDNAKKQRLVQSCPVEVEDMIDTSADIIMTADSLFKGAKPLEGEALEILKQTFKKSFKQTPTRL